MFFCSQISSNCCLRSRIFPFNPFWLAGTNRKITFWRPWTYLKLIIYSLFGFPCKLPNWVALRGQRSKKNRYLRIQKNLLISAFKLSLIADSESTFNSVKIRPKIIDVHSFCVELWPNQVLHRLSVPMSYISLREWQKVVPQGPFGRIKL